MWLLCVEFVCHIILSVCCFVYSSKLYFNLVKLTAAKWWYEAGYLLKNKIVKQRDEIDYVNEKCAQLSKIPVHMCLALGEDDASYEQLSRIILWSLAAGVPVLSFYDHKNELNADELYKSFNKMYPSLMNCVEWAVSFDVQQNTNDTRYNSAVSRPFALHSIRVNALDSRYGRQLLLDSIKELCETTRVDGVFPPQDRVFAENALDTIMRSKLHGSDNPDFLLISGNAYITYGLSPWHIGFTEFLTTPSYKLLTVTDYVRILQTYAKCEQKFGR